MHPWQVVHQVMIEFLEFFQSNHPRRLVHGVHQASTNKRNDPLSQGLLQHLLNRWVYPSHAVAILHLHQTQDKQPNERGHAVTVKRAPRLLSLFMHTYRMAIHGRPLASRSPPQVFCSTHIDGTAQATQGPSRFGHFWAKLTKVKTARTQS